MGWVHRRPPDETAHRCATPEKPVLVSASMAGAPPTAVADWFEPDGRPGDLWRCELCGRLWRIGGHGTVWLPATFRQRLRYRREGRG